MSAVWFPIHTAGGGETRHTQGETGVQRSVRIIESIGGLSEEPRSHRVSKLRMRRGGATSEEGLRNRRSLLVGVQPLWAIGESGGEGGFDS